jgi:hypothetical protein
MKTLEDFKKEVELITGKDIYSFDSVKGIDSQSFMFALMGIQEEVLALHKRIKSLEAKQ